MNSETNILRFQVGKTYFTRSICDSECIYQITVKSRTEKTIRTECGKTLRVKAMFGVELVKPMGTYSMCPVIHADKVVS